METVIAELPRFVQKRDNKTQQSFEIDKIKRAIRKACATASEIIDDTVLDIIASYVLESIQGREHIGVEYIQDAVEKALMKFNKLSAAKSYILYREERAEKRRERKKPDPKAIADYIHPSKYGRHIEELNRRESYDETIDRVQVMHTKKFSKFGIKDIINDTFALVREKKVLPSMRAMQFAGPAIEKNNCRQYNCSATHIDRPEAFSESFYLLLCGSGVGFSAQIPHVEKLPRLSFVNEHNVIHHTIADTIEGWADALKALVYSHINGSYIQFNYSDLRAEGEPLKTSGGKAPGHMALMRSIEAIRGVLQRASGRKLRPIECHDIMCLAAEAVLSGGIRRSSLISLFSLEDSEMMYAKTGDWHKTHPWRQNANNSVMLVHGKVEKDQFDRIFELTKEWGEPGFVFANNINYLYNPCQPGWAPLLTPDGIKKFDDVSIGSVIWSGKRWTKIVNKIETGVKRVYAYGTTAGVFFGTDKHRVVSAGIKIEVGQAESIDIALGGAERGPMTPQIIMDGLVLGDGSVHKASNDLVYLCVGEDDSDYLTSEVATLMERSRPGLSDIAWEIVTSISAAELPKTYNRTIPDRYVYGDPTVVRSFLRGLYSANGSMVRDRVTLKASSLNVIKQAQMMLSSLGIASYYTTNKSSTVKFDNGDYECKQSYDLNITWCRDKFLNLIGFIQKYKQDKLISACNQAVRGSRGKRTFDIIDVCDMGEHKVYDITVDDEDHTYWTGGHLVSNCGEAQLHPVLTIDDDVLSIVGQLRSEGRDIPQLDIGDTFTGFSFCNLTEINAAKLTSYEDFERAAYAATVIGTLQAAYNSMPYLGWVSEAILRRDALLGVSMTGMLDAPSIACNPEYQCKIAKKILGWNAELSKIIEIRPAARTTLVKPSGTSSLELNGVASGHHAHHARRYIRRVTANSNEPVFQYFKSINPHMCIKKPNNDWVIEFAVEAPQGAIIKDDLGAIQFLDMIKSTQTNWTKNGNSEASKKAGLCHNVSNTVHVKDGEWGDVRSYLWNNRDSLSAVSLLSMVGDKQYQFAPMEAITTSADETRWNQIIELYKPVNYSLMYESEDNTSLKGEAACYAGQCER